METCRIKQFDVRIVITSFADQNPGQKRKASTFHVFENIIAAFCWSGGRWAVVLPDTITLPNWARAPLSQHAITLKRTSAQVLFQTRYVVKHFESKINIRHHAKAVCEAKEIEVQKEYSKVQFSQLGLAHWVREITKQRFCLLPRCIFWIRLRHAWSGRTAVLALRLQEVCQRPYRSVDMHCIRAVLEWFVSCPVLSTGYTLRNSINCCKNGFYFNGSQNRSYGPVVNS